MIGHVLLVFSFFFLVSVNADFNVVNTSKKLDSRHKVVLNETHVLTFLLTILLGHVLVWFMLLVRVA